MYNIHLTLNYTLGIIKVRTMVLIRWWIRTCFARIKKIGLFEKKTNLWLLSARDQIIEIAPYLRTYFWVTIWYKYQGQDQWWCFYYTTQKYLHILIRRVFILYSYAFIVPRAHDAIIWLCYQKKLKEENDKESKERNENNFRISKALI